MLCLNMGTSLQERFLLPLLVNINTSSSCKPFCKRYTIDRLHLLTLWLLPSCSITPFSTLTSMVSESPLLSSSDSDCFHFLGLEWGAPQRSGKTLLFLGSPKTKKNIYKTWSAKAPRDAPSRGLKRRKSILLGHFGCTSSKETKKNIYFYFLSFLLLQVASSNMIWHFRICYSSRRSAWYFFSWIPLLLQEFTGFLPATVVTWTFNDRVCFFLFSKAQIGNWQSALFLGAPISLQVLRL